jgi:hypothetical protein
MLGMRTASIVENREAIDGARTSGVFDEKMKTTPGLRIEDLLPKEATTS